MKLDRNTNPDGRGKYALVKLRDVNLSSDGDVHNAIELLRERGMLHFGIEGPGEQFFVMKYSDKFTAAGLAGYADHVKEYALQGAIDEATSESLLEYAKEIAREVNLARESATKIPD